MFWMFIENSGYYTIFHSKNKKGFIIAVQITHGDMMDNLLLLSVILLMGICILLLVLNIYTYKVTKNKKVLIVSFAFLLFFIQALFVFLSEILDTLEFIKEVRILLFIDLLVVLIIYIATVKSPSKGRYIEHEKSPGKGSGDTEEAD